MYVFIRVYKTLCLYSFHFSLYIYLCARSQCLTPAQGLHPIIYSLIDIFIFFFLTRSFLSSFIYAKVFSCWSTSKQKGKFVSSSHHHTSFLVNDFVYTFSFQFLWESGFCPSCPSSLSLFHLNYLVHFFHQNCTASFAVKFNNSSQPSFSGALSITWHCWPLPPSGSPL